jgi:hypothetical protein
LLKLKRLSSVDKKPENVSASATQRYYNTGGSKWAHPEKM